MEKEIANMLMESRIHHQAPLQVGWIATAEHCVELVNVRLTAIIDGGFRH